MTTLNDDIYIFHNMSELFLHSKIQKLAGKFVEIWGHLRDFLYGPNYWKKCIPTAYIATLK